jgi:hypothetical protein
MSVGTWDDVQNQKKGKVEKGKEKKKERNKRL